MTGSPNTGHVGTLEERGLPSDSFFVIELKDGTTITEKESNWSSISEPHEVTYFDIKKTAHICTLPVKKISVFHGDLSCSLEVPDDCKAFQAVRAHTVLMGGGVVRKNVSGRLIGIIRDGAIIEEHFINAIEGTVTGLRR